MNADEMVLVTLNGRVTALKRDGGQMVWSTKLPGGAGFVTLTGEGQKVYAASAGQVYCLDLISGKILWNNGLKGQGYGVAAIWLPGQAPAPPQAAYGEMHSEQSGGGTEAALAACC